MRIERPDKPIPYLNNRDRRRLLAQVTLLFLVILAIGKASDPDTWTGILNALERAGKPREVAEKKEPNLQVRSDDEELKPGEFKASKGGDESDKTSDGDTPESKVAKTGTEPSKQVDDSEKAAKSATPTENEKTQNDKNNEPAKVAEIDADAEKSKTDIAKDDGAVPKAKPNEQPELKTPEEEWALNDLIVPKKYIDMIKDRTVYVRSYEAESYYRILARIQRQNPKLVKARSIKAAGWLVLMDEPDFHRGKLVSVRGELRRLDTQEVPEGNKFRKQFGIETLYHAYIFPDDRPKDPYHVVVTSIPKGIPTGEEISQTVPVTVEGYFFKKEGYGTESLKGHVAPLILGRTLGWKKPDFAPIPESENFTLYLLIASAGLFVIVVFVTFRQRRGDAAFKQGQLKSATTPPDEAIEALNHIEGKELHEQLRELAESET